jgi:hypothetical protein
MVAAGVATLTMFVVANDDRDTVGADWRMGLRRVWTLIWLALVLAACGGSSELELTEYVERLNAIVDQARQDYEVLVASPRGGVLVAEGIELTAFTPQDLPFALEQVREIEAAVDEATSAIDPPEQVADLRQLFFDFDGGFISAQDGLAARASTAADWRELSDSTEMAAYRAALAKDKQDCVDAQAEVNAIGEQREVFADTPWIPGQLKELFEVALGCDGYPDQPADVYCPPSTSTL